MEEIKITKITSKETKTGKPYKMCEVEVNGEIRKVNIWSNAPDFANLKEGSVVMGNMEMDGQYWNIKFEGAKPQGNSNFKSAQIEKIVERKEKSISNFQDNKELSIKIARTMNKAVDLAIAEIKDITTLNTLEADILKWREWLWKNWDVEPTDYPPFN